MEVYQIKNEEDIRKHIGELDPKLVESNFFKHKLYEIFNGLENKGTIKMQILDDGKKIRLSCFSDNDTLLGDLASVYKQNEIYLGDANNIIVDKSLGNMIDPLDKKSKYDALLYVVHSFDSWTLDGIQKTHCEYTDTYPLRGLHLRDKKEVCIQTMLHKPEFYKNGYPGVYRNPNYIENAHVKIQQSYLGTVKSCTYDINSVSGKQNIRRTISPLHMEHPETIRADYEILEVTNSGIKLDPMGKQYEGLTYEEILEKLKERYFEVLETCRTKDYDYEIYDALISSCNQQNGKSR